MLCFVNKGLVCSFSKNSLVSFCFVRGRALAQVRYFSRYSCLFPNRILIQCFCEVNSLSVVQLGAPPQTDIQYVR